MDEIDKRIILQLDENCRKSYEAMARKFGMTANAIKKRVNRLLDEGLIRRFIVGLSLEMIGAELVIALVQTDGTEFPEEFMKQIGESIDAIQVSPVACGIGSLYCVFAFATGPKGILELGGHLRSMKPTTNVDIHILVYPKGKKMELSKTHLKVLKALLEDPRMAISDISKRAGLTARRVRRALNELQDGGAVHLSVFWSLGSGSLTEVLVRIEWDSATASADEIVNWLRKRYQHEFWSPFISATSPTIFARCVVEQLEKADQIMRQLKKAPFAEKISSLVFFSTHVFEWPGTLKLQGLLEEEGV
ncbi:MAG: winged helix-turn-helix transcriptional regulator [Candidatus Thorarchaeota archaeon SMTZ1-45]